MVEKKCGRCINGFVMTGYGPKPCMYCKGRGYIYTEENDNSSNLVDNQNYESSSESDYKSSCFGQLLILVRNVIIVFGSILLVAYCAQVIGGG